MPWMRALALALATAGLRAPAAVAQETPSIGDKTLVAWVTLADLHQRGGSVLTLEKPGGAFDAIVFGEIAPGKWMAGSNEFLRTHRDQQAWPEETAGPQTLVQIALVYRGEEIAIYRNGRVYSRYTAGARESFGDDSFVLMGLRHLEAAPGNRFFTGSIEEARIYDTALSAEQIASLEPGVPPAPEPLAWWDFEDGNARDRRGRFPVTTLVGAARVTGGRLHFGPGGAWLLASAEAPRASPTESEAAAVARRLRESLLRDPHRPGYHFVVPEGRAIPFDPNGAIFWKGRYHLFYIFQDERGHNWGHVSSTDLFHWRHHPTGLVSGMFSGNCFLNKEGRPTISYHQVGQGNAIAVALDDELNEWEKLPSNPITPETRPGDPFHDRYRSWDPYAWVEGDIYYAIFGGNRPALVKSARLEGEWQYVGDLMGCSVPGVAIDEDVSCPDFFRLGDKYMLLCISHRLGCRYYLGDWRDEKFYPTFHARMSWVDNLFFAPESLLDDRGRRIMWAWVFDDPDFGTRMDYGWSGTMSLPRVLTLGDDGMLRMNPPREIEGLRYNERRLSRLSIAADSEQTLDAIRGNSIELRIEAEVRDASQFGLEVCRSPDGAEETRIYYDALDKKLKIDTRRSSLGPGWKGIEAGPFELKAGELLTLRVFVDKSIVEVFANGRQAVVRRIYPTRRDSVGVALFSKGGPATVTTLQAWDLMPSNPY